MNSGSDQPTDQCYDAEMLITPEQLADSYTEGNTVIFDCRFNLADTELGQRAYEQGHIPGAIYAHLDRHLSSPITPDTGRHPLPDPKRLLQWLREWGVSRNSQVVVYDDAGGAIALRLWWLLRWLGHQSVTLLDGGWQAWMESGKPQSTEPPTRPVDGDYIVKPDTRLVVSTAEILADVTSDSPRLLLIDARTAERYRGESEPIDPVAGSIPGACNLPLQKNLDSNGRFLPPGQLREIYQPLLGQHAVDDVVAYCGSGVTACHTLFALELAGFGLGRLYADSWSGWIRDDQRPIQQPGVTG